MRLAVISDVHGNSTALDAVMSGLGREGVDEAVCLGDVSIGPEPGEALERIRELGCPVIMGNWRASSAGSSSSKPSGRQAGSRRRIGR